MGPSTAVLIRGARAAQENANARASEARVACGREEVLRSLMPNGIWPLGLAVVFAGFLVAACDEAEQGRILRYEKGTYLGPSDSGLEPGQVDELRQRAKLQGGV